MIFRMHPYTSTSPKQAQVFSMCSSKVTLYFFFSSKDCVSLRCGNVWERTNWSQSDEKLTPSSLQMFQNQLKVSKIMSENHQKMSAYSTCTFPLHYIFIQILQVTFQFAAQEKGLPCCQVNILLQPNCCWLKPPANKNFGYFSLFFKTTVAYNR